MHEAEAVESRGLIVLAQFDRRTAILADARRVLRETPGDIQGVWGDGEAGAEAGAGAGAESVGRLVQRAEAENAEPLVGRDPRPWAEAWAEWSRAPDPFG